MADVVILGAGVMGSAMAMPASAQGSGVDLVGTHLDSEIIRSVANNGFHPRLGVTMPEGLKAYEWTELGKALSDTPKLIVLGVASAGVNWAIDRLAETMTRPIPILMITKGLASDGNSIETLPSLVGRELQKRLGFPTPLLAVGGPCIAGELAVRRDTSIVIAGDDGDLMSAAVKQLLAPYYHVQMTTDITGVEVCAAFKNFYAIGVGSVKGRLEAEGPASNQALMHNLSSSTFTQALREMRLLVTSLGGFPDTVGGLAGTGDLYVTCQAGRNGRMGRLLGLGHRYSTAKSEHMPNDTVEGANLALDLGPVLLNMMADGRLAERDLPLTRSIIDAICYDAPLSLDFAHFHGGLSSTYS